MKTPRTFVRLTCLMMLSACGPANLDESDGTDPDTMTPDLPNELDPCDCESGATCVLWRSDGGCSLGCTPLPPSCGAAPSCDPACNWDLCGTVACAGEATEDDLTCLFEPQSPATAWQCNEPYGPCNPWFDQDCPDMEKCQPSGDGWWTTAHCQAPSAMPAAVGEPCLSEDHLYAGIDDCQAHATCWNVDPNTHIGTCVPQCSGAPHDPLCPNGTTCALVDPMWAAFCLPTCDPLGDSCAPGYGCMLLGETLACAPLDQQLAAGGEPCEHPNDCASGLACVDASELADCTGERCCTEFCQLDSPSCPLDAPNCTPALAQSPQELAHVGVCAAS